MILAFCITPVVVGLQVWGSMLSYMNNEIYKERFEEGIASSWPASLRCTWRSAPGNSQSLNGAPFLSAPGWTQRASYT